jgi:hypothetical protein
LQQELLFLEVDQVAALVSACGLQHEELKCNPKY